MHAAKWNKTQSEYEDAVRKAKEYIAAGDTFQIQVSRRLHRRTTAHPFAIYRALRRINPSPWMYYFNFDGLFSIRPHRAAAAVAHHRRIARTACAL